MAYFHSPLYVGCLAWCMETALRSSQVLMVVVCSPWLLHDRLGHLVEMLAVHVNVDQSIRPAPLRSRRGGRQ